VAFVVGSLAGMASCGATDEGSLNPKPSSTSTPATGDEDGGTVDGGSTTAVDAGGSDGGTAPVTRGRTLLVQGGNVTFLGRDERRRPCPDEDGGVGCGPEFFSGALVIRGARLSILPGIQDDDAGVPVADNDGGTSSAPDDGGAGGGGGEDGGLPTLSGNALVSVEGALLTFGLQASADAGVGVPPTGEDGGSAVTPASAELRGGRMLVALERDVEGNDDGGVASGNGFRGRRHEVVRVRAVVIQGAVFHLPGAGDADDAGLR
jgi:hypothetical protein